MAQLSPADVAAKWVANIGSSTNAIRMGVQAVTTAPGQLASQAADLWQQRVSSQQARDKFSRNTAKVTLEDWRTAMLNKGVPRVATGAQQAQAKFAAFMSQFLPFVNNVAQRVRQMPKATLEDRIARMVAQVRGTAGFTPSA